MSEDKKKEGKKEYNFGGLKEFNLEQIESEVLNDSVYLDVFAGSDVAFKEDIKPLEGAMDKISALQAFTYNYKTEEFPEKNFDSERQVGLIANEVEKVLPEVVRKDNNGMRHINYAALTPLLLEGIKSLSDRLDRQADEIAELKALIKKH